METFYNILNTALYLTIGFGAGYIVRDLTDPFHSYINKWLNKKAKKIT